MRVIEDNLAWEDGSIFWKGLIGSLRNLALR